MSAGTWCCGWDGCPDKGIRRQAADVDAALDHHYRTHHQHEAHRIIGQTHAQAWGAIDARAIASGKRRASPQQQQVARQVVAEQKQRRAS